MPNDHYAGWPAPRAQYPWKQGDILIADELNAAIANSGNGGGGLFLPNFLPAGQPDGTTDLSIYIQQAIDAAAGHGALVIPANANPYVIGTLYIPSNTHLVIEPGATLKLKAANGDGMFLLTDDRVSRLRGVNNVYIELRGTLDGNASNQTAGPSGGISSLGSPSLGGSTDIYIDGFHQGLITNFLNWPLGLGRVTNSEVRNLAMTNCGNSVGYNGVTSGGVTIKSYNVGFTNCTVQDIRDIGITLYGGCESSYIRGCQLLNGASALIFLDNGQPGVNVDCEISGCFQSGGEGGIGTSSNSPPVSNRNCRIFNNTIENAHGAGLQIGGVDYCEVYGNVVHDSGVTFQTVSGQGGMATISGTTHVNFHDNAIRNTTSPGYYSRHTTNTIASLVSYNPTTGAVSLSTTAAHPIVVGDQFSIFNAFGSGAYLSLNGFWTATAGTTGSTVNFTGPTGLTLSALTSGTVAKYTNAVAVTITSGLYAPSTGDVVLTTSAPHGMPMTPGIPQPFIISGITGTGPVANLNGYQTATAGTDTAESIITFTTTANLAAMTITGGTILPPTFGVSITQSDYCRVTNNHIGDWQTTKNMAACIGGQWGTDCYTEGNIYGPRLATGPLYGFPADATVYVTGSGTTQGVSYDSVRDVYSGAIGDRNIAGETFFNNRALSVGWNLSSGQGETDFMCGQSGGTRGGFNFFQVSNDGTINPSVGAGGSLLANDGYGNTRLGGALVHGAMQAASLVNGGTYTVNPNTSLALIQNTTSIAAATIVLPTPAASAYSAGAELELNFQNPVGTLSWSGASVSGPVPTIQSAGASLRFVQSGTTWRPLLSDAYGVPPVGGPYLALTGGTVSGATTFSSNVTMGSATSNGTLIGGGSATVKVQVTGGASQAFVQSTGGPLTLAAPTNTNVNVSPVGTGQFVVNQAMTANLFTNGAPTQVGNGYNGANFIVGTDSIAVPVGQGVNWMLLSGNVGALPWTPSTAVALNAQRNNGGNIYNCTTAGTTASSGGPTGTGTGITDGSAVWSYLKSDHVGIRQALNVGIDVRSPPGPTATAQQKQWPGILASFQGSANVGGTSNTTGNALGTGYASADQSWLYSGATFWQALVGREVDVGIFTGASAKSRYGLNVVSYGNVNGAQEDNAIVFGSSGAGGGGNIPWLDVLHLGEGAVSAGTHSLFSYYPRPQGTLTAGGLTYINPTTVQGFDLSNILVTGNAFRSPGNGGIDGTGAVFSGAAKLSTSSSAVSLDAVGSIITAVPTIDGGVPTPGGFKAGDQLYDTGGYGCIITVDTVDGGGKPLSWTLTQAGGTLVATPANPVTFFGGSGVNSRFNLTWTRVSALLLNPSGGATTFGGPVTLPTAVTLGTGTGTPILTLNGAAGANKGIYWQNAGTNRWRLQTDASDNMGLYAYDAAGAFIDTGVLFNSSTKTITSNFQIATTNVNATGVNGITGAWFTASNTGANPASGHKFNYNSKAGNSGFDCALVNFAVFDPTFVAGQHPAEGGIWFVAMSPNDQTNFFGCNVGELNIVNRGPDAGWHRDRSSGVANPTGVLLAVPEVQNFGVATGGEGKSVLYGFSTSHSAGTNSTGFPAKFYNNFLIEPNSTVGLTGRAIYATGDISGVASQYPYGPLQIDSTWLHGIDHTLANYIDNYAEAFGVNQTIGWIVGTTAAPTAVATIGGAGSGTNASLVLTPAGASGVITLGGAVTQTSGTFNALVATFSSVQTGGAGVIQAGSVSTNNAIRLTPVAAGTQPTIAAIGVDANINLNIIAQGTGGIRLQSNVGFYNTPPVAKQTLTGAKGSNAALASVIAALVGLGLVTDTTTA